jgi:two-component system sensor histidine kinase SenX3
MLLAIGVSLLLGGMIGFVLASRVRRSVDSTPPVPAPKREPAIDIGSVLHSAADQLELGVVIAGTDGSIIFRNRAATMMNGTHVGVIVEDNFERALEAARRGERVDDLVELHGPPRVALQLVAEPMPDGSAVATFEDVSERRRIDVARTDFVANISHELKTPVGAIAVLAEALAGESDPDVVGRVAERMADEARRAVQTIDDLLELSRIESGPLLEEVVVLDDVVTAAIARGRVVNESAGVTVTAFDSGGSVRLLADGRQLVAALGNLVENAVKYSDAGDAVQVRTRVDDEAIEVVVADQGIGIPARDLGRIFERFYRVDRARSRQTGGTGLGLSIVRHVASNHGGEVLVSSHEGEGSTFVLRLPASLVLTDPAPDEPVEVTADTGDRQGSASSPSADSVLEQHQ